ncbi:phosphopantetheine-binding protein [Aureispira anguillae]|uniref:Phosphopantetheine-binding protein n=1 Tax=Aureispira anguillae TaxID=2864201 RepID=A0A916DVQ6_9BACT|nr:phosphopantetheine-binding protein [Aureispira anguillae]BDS13977.1 phosphopantetheine-binding protein [Aureispira anguillae]
MESTALKEKLKQQIIDYLNLIDVEPEDLEDDSPLFGPDGDLGLDSIDSVELLVLLEREYELKITDPKEGRKVLVDVNSMAQYIIDEGKA